MWVHKRLTVFALLVSSCVFGAGCQTTDNSNAVTGGVVGTGLGALTGAVVGSAFGRRDAAIGALAGAAAGGVGGALLGHSQDVKNEQNAAAAQAQYQQAQAAADQAALTNADIVYMVRSGLSAEVVGSTGYVNGNATALQNVIGVTKGVGAGNVAVCVTGDVAAVCAGWLDGARARLTAAIAARETADGPNAQDAPF